MHKAAPLTAAEQRRARLLALIDQCHARDHAAQRRSSRYAAPGPPRSTNPLDDPATDPMRWQGFI